MDFSVIEDYIVPHWPFIAFVLLCGTIVQVFKATIWTEKRALTGKAKLFFWWGRKTLPLHPAVSGALIGLIPGLPLSQGVEHTMATASLYYGTAGIISAWIFDIVKGLAKKRGFELPFDDDDPDTARDKVDTSPETPIPKGVGSEPPELQ